VAARGYRFGEVREASATDSPFSRRFHPERRRRAASASFTTSSRKYRRWPPSVTMHGSLPSRPQRLIVLDDTPKMAPTSARLSVLARPDDDLLALLMMRTP
jgi:hypothetical protein